MPYALQLSLNASSVCRNAIVRFESLPDIVRLEILSNGGLKVDPPKDRDFRTCSKNHVVSLIYQVYA